MMTIWLLVISIVMVAISGCPGLLLSRRGVAGQRIAAVLNVMSSSLGIAGLVLHFAGPEISHQISVPWTLPIGRVDIALDDLSVIFLIPIFLISALGAVYGLSYWSQREHAGNGRKLRLCWGLLTAGMALVVLARDGVLFLMAWEIMALAAFFLVATEDAKREVREAAWVYLVATHVGTLCLFGFFALLRYVTGSFALWPSTLATASPHMATALFILGAVGFGLKAGIMPLHVWLPGAHANAPSHVSAVMSGVLLKTGVYGLVRIAALVPHPPVWWGATLLVAGALSAVLGISFAVGQRDLKRLLAYSSIENVGIIVLGIGLATLGRSLDQPDWVVLGLGGALLHVLNHSFFKPLLFMGAGSILHVTHTREMDHLGGLGNRMPGTFILFLIGAVAITGLPPLNGFVSELFLYIGLFKTAVATSSGWGWVSLAAPALALVGALAVGSFVKLLGAVFAGAPRSLRTAHAHDPDRKMLAPMWILAGCCVLIGVLPARVVGVLDRAIADWAPHTRQPLGSIVSYMPMGWLTAIALALLAAVALGGLWFSRWPATRAARAAGTWDCGYARPTASMQYSGSSLSQMMVDLLAWVLWPRRKPPRINGVFAAPTDFASDIPDVVLDRALLPAFGSAEWLLGWARVIQRGPIQLYLLYVLGILVILLLFA
jgi:hydrogenase-4 component B